MKKWEYTVYNIERGEYGPILDFDKILDVLDTLGADGWEVVSTDWQAGLVFLKKEVD